MSSSETAYYANQFLQSLLATIAIILFLIPIAFKINLVDHPCSRKQHQGKIPLIGGLAIYFSLMFGVLAGNVSIPGENSFLAAITIIVVTGLIDDYKSINYKLRFGAEIVAALIMIKGGGIYISSLGNLLGFGEIQLGEFSTLFTVFAIVGGINAFNMIDGIDGLAASTALIVYLLLSTLCIFNVCHDYLPLLTILVPATVAFLLFNFPIPGRQRAWIFLGDTGSMLFGFTICWLVISATQGENRIIAPVSALWLIAVPLLDTVSVMIRRMRRGRSPFAPDREHFHHIFPVAGYGKRATLVGILMTTATLAAIGLLSDLVLDVPEWLMFFLFGGVFAAYYWSMCHAWRFVKIARYLRNRHHGHERRKLKDRRQNVVSALPFPDRRVLLQRRVTPDRRLQASARDLQFFQKLLTVFSRTASLRSAAPINRLISGTTASPNSAANPDAITTATTLYRPPFVNLDKSANAFTSRQGIER